MSIIYLKSWVRDGLHAPGDPHHFRSGFCLAVPVEGEVMSFHSEVLEQSLRKLFAGRYFDICTVNSIGEMLGTEPRQHPDYKYLSALHCVHYSEKPAFTGYTGGEGGIRTQSAWFSALWCAYGLFWITFNISRLQSVLHTGIHTAAPGSTQNGDKTGNLAPPSLRKLPR